MTSGERNILTIQSQINPTFQKKFEICDPKGYWMSLLKMIPISVTSNKIIEDDKIATNDNQNHLQTQDVDETTNTKPEPIYIHELKYSLNPVENIKKAKANLKRSLKISRILVDNENIKFDINSAAYIELKKETDKYKTGDKFVHPNGKNKLEVTKVRRNTTKKQKNVAEALVWWDITDTKSGLKSKCVQQMYHTTQGVHLQGGQTLPTTTTTELLADFLEQEWRSLLEKRKESIKVTIKSIEDIDIEAFKTMVELTKDLKKTPKQPEKTNLECEDCDFKSVSPIAMRKHSYIKHELVNKNINRDKRKTIRKLPSIEEEPVNSTNESTISPTNSPPTKKSIMEAKKCEKCLFETKVEQEMKDHTMKVHEAISNAIEDAGSWNLQTSRGFKGKPTNPKQNLNEESTADEVEKVFEQINKTTTKERSPVVCVETSLEVLAETLIANPVEGEVAVLITNLEKESSDKTKQLVEMELELKKQASQLVDFEMYLLATRKQKIEAEEAKLKVVKEKAMVEKTYRECSEVVGIQQKRIEELEEKVKVMENLRRIEEMEKIKALEIVENGGNLADVERETTTNEGDGWIQWEPDYMEAESRPNTFDCKKCDKIFRTLPQLKHHEKEHKRKIPCNICKFECTETDEFIEHAIKFHQTQFPSFKCDTCGEVFAKSSTLVAHVVRVHGFTYTTRNQNHNNASNQAQQTPPQNGSVTTNQNLKCFDCGNNFQDKQGLYVHKRANHNKQNLCGHYHGMGSGCRFPDSVCINIHGERSSEKTKQAISQIPCKHGDKCTYFAQNRCKYGHMNMFNVNPQNNTTYNQESHENGNQNASNVNFQTPPSRAPESHIGNTLWQHIQTRNNQEQQQPINTNQPTNQNTTQSSEQNINTNQTSTQNMNMNDLMECVREVIRTEFSSNIQSLTDFPNLVKKPRKVQ